MKKYASCQLPQDTSIRRILVIKWSALGDLIIATSAFENIFKAFPNSEVHLNTLPQWKPLFEADPRFKKILALPVKVPTKQFATTKNWVAHVREERYDAVFDLQENDRSRLFLSFLLLSGDETRYRVSGQKYFPYNAGPGLPNAPMHDFERHNTILRHVNVPQVATVPHLYLPDHCNDRVATIQKNYHLNPLHYVILITGSHPRWVTKRWGTDRYLTLAKLLHQQGVDKIVLVGSEAEEALCDFIAKQSGPWVVNLCGKLGLPEIPVLAKQALGIIGNDTGPIHLASVAKRPLIVICGPTNSTLVRPIGPHIRVLQANLPCLNCYQRTCNRHACMKAITPDRVLEAFKALV